MFAVIAIMGSELILKYYGPFALCLFGGAVVISRLYQAAILFGVIWALASLIPGYSRKTGLVILALIAANAAYSELAAPKLKDLKTEPCPAVYEDRDYNILFISIDTLRADRLGAYGYERETSPNIDALASESFLFENCFSQAPATLISHSTMFTGLYPGAHGAQCMTFSALPPSAQTLPEILALNGYRTAGFTGGAQLGRFFGFSQGFETYYDEGGGFKETWPRARKWLDENSGEKFFLFLHTFDVHHPYKPPPPFNTMFAKDYDGPLEDFIPIELLEAINAGEIEVTKEDREYISSVYDGGIRYVDGYIGRIVNYLKEKGLLDKTIIVFTSDHGEEFDEHGVIGMHAHTVYDELLHVPLIIRVPEAEPRKISRRVGLVDLVPSLLDFTGISYPPDAFQGATFSGMAEDELNCPPEKRTLYAEKEYLSVEDYGRMKAIKNGDWKFKMLTMPPRPRAFFRVVGSLVYPVRGKELYNISADPGEKVNRLSSRAPLARAMEAALYDYMKRNEKNLLEGTGKVNLSTSEATRLKNLGYLK